MKKTIIFISLLTIGLSLLSLEHAQTSESQVTPTHPARDSFYRARVEQILSSGVQDLDGKPQAYQVLKLVLLDSDRAGSSVTIANGKDFVVGTYQNYAVGETLVLTRPASGDDHASPYYIVDRYRLTNIYWLIAVFLFLAALFGRRRGIMSFVGLALGALIIFLYIIPRIIAGADPLFTCIVGSVAIMVSSLYLSHGYNRRTTIALVASLASLLLAVVINIIFVYVAKLSGGGTEEAFYLQFGDGVLNLRGILLGGIIIGVLGVLDDVTTGQSAAIEEIKRANESISFRELYRGGISVGREHIASLINTLFLTYVGASFPLLLLYTTQNSSPIWVTLNSNFISEELVRTLVGSSTLIVAVPLTTLLASWWLSRKPQK